MFTEGNKIIDEARQGEVLQKKIVSENKKKLFLESYGCQMNFADSEIVASIMEADGFSTTSEILEADVIFLNTCAIRDNAEQKIWQRLRQFKKNKQQKPELIVGVLGCMAERLKSKLLEEEKLVDLVVGPDAYRDLPGLICTVESGQKAVNVLLSREETYAGISPVRLSSNGITAFISIMRGCDNMCSFCVVPFTRGRERSRDHKSIVTEAEELVANGYKEVTLLGQNVDSYNYGDEVTGEKVNFAQLLARVASVDPGLRVRFSTSHPKDITDEVLYTILRYENICNYIHLPVQSGSSRVLEIMNRKYSREWYMDKIRAIKSIIPDCGISTDIITGFCTETEEDHKETLSLIKWVGYEYAYMFKYSERPGTLAARKFIDDVPEEMKGRRLQEIIDLQHKMSLLSNQKDIGKMHKVLVENYSKRSNDHLSGRNDQNKVVIFPKENYKPGDYVHVLATECSSATLKGISVST
ncbi:MAG: tRNA (N6-isopentenyl adenosine(37)-C2)-methylthiotransferase MiaB [Bacteroidia bacterium]